MKNEFIPKIINLERDSLLLEVPQNQIDRYDYLLNGIDKKEVHDILKYVQQGELDTYLGGGVVQNHLKGRKGYGDIDILAVGNKGKLAGVVEPLLRAKNNIIPFVTGNNGTRFNVKFKHFDDIEKRYLCFNFEEKFTLNPKGVVNWLRRVSPIDLVFVDENYFEISLERVKTK